MKPCPVCYMSYSNWPGVAEHMYNKSGKNDAVHISWLNRHISIKEMSPTSLSERLNDFFSARDGLAGWIKRRFIETFYGEKVHPFIAAMQSPTKEVLLGYVIEHQHFLVNWVKVLSSIVYRTDKLDVMDYELENIRTEYLGTEKTPSHHELLLRMGESLGMKREKVLSFEPLPTTTRAIKTWLNIAEERSWVEVMAAMHSLELVADKTLRKYGAKVHYFNEEILKTDSYPREVRDFLREGYEADVGHANYALSLVEKYAERGEEVQVTVVKSFDAFYDYLNARLERAKMLVS
ncbi:TenA family transcriptional regulator [Sulfolobales archaeon HS-7]|nr:TenA family transcriptional regulator [Sulfolobales archaeon HS-7]